MTPDDGTIQAKIAEITASTKDNAAIQAKIVAMLSERLTGRTFTGLCERPHGRFKEHTLPRPVTVATYRDGRARVGDVLLTDALLTDFEVCDDSMILWHAAEVANSTRGLRGRGDEWYGLWGVVGRRSRRSLERTAGKASSRPAANAA